MSATSKSSLVWTYRHGGENDLVESGTVIGREVGLPAHFHDEDQLTVVQAGQRRFIVGGGTVILRPGRCALIPAGTVHRSVTEPSGVACLNFYLPAARYALPAMIDEVERVPFGTESIGCSVLMAIVRRHRLGFLQASPWEVRRPTVVPLTRGISREGFGRAYKRMHGMPPHAHDLAIRLNQARRQLRAGSAIAETAFDTGFADQSHFGRWFRRVFGVTPGRYRAAITNVPDARVNAP